MKEFTWNGIVGWDIWASDVISQLKSAKGDDITINFSSEGGSVFDGVEVYNALSDYRRDNPEAKIIFNVKGLMASMGSYIPSNPAINTVNIEENVSFMIHNPWSLAAGDFHEMQKTSDFLEGLAGIMAPSYAKRAGITIDEAHALMDAETWLFGQEIIDAGFADSMIPAADSGDGEPESNTTKIQAVAMAKMQFGEMKKKFKSLGEDQGFDTERAAALLVVAPPAPNEPEEDNDPGSLPDETTPVPNGNNNGGSPKVETKSELINELPEVYAESKKDGVTEERERVAVLMAMKKEEAYQKLPKVLAVIDESIEKGRSKNETLPLVMAVIVSPEASAALDSPDDIAGSNDDNPAPETAKKPAAKIREV